MSLMKIIVLAGLAVFFTCDSAFAADVGNQETTRLAKKVDTLLASWSQRDGPGAAVIVIKDGRVLLKKGFGLANIENKKPIDSDTAFRLASVTKQFTAMAVMMLVGYLQSER